MVALGGCNAIVFTAGLGRKIRRLTVWLWENISYLGVKN